MASILIIDDDNFIRNLVGTVLKKSGYTVFSAENGEKGVELAQKENPDLVLTDMLMPDKEGIQTICEIKEINPNIKIIAMSGGGKTKNLTFLDMAKKVGADEILSKPFKPNDLLSIIKKLNIV